MKGESTSAGWYNKIFIIQGNAAQQLIYRHNAIQQTNKNFKP